MNVYAVVVRVGGTVDEKYTVVARSIIPAMETAVQKTMRTYDTSDVIVKSITEVAQDVLVAT